MSQTAPVATDLNANRPPAFAARAVPRPVIESILEVSRRAPSGTNTQPWKVCVVQGASRDLLVAGAQAQVPQLCADAQRQMLFWEQYKRVPGRTAWPGPAWESRGEDYPASADAAFGNGALASEHDLTAYFGLYQAPVALVCTIDRVMGLGSMLDYGMFVQNLVLSAAARGLHAEVQAGWKGFADDLVLPLVQAPADELLVAVLALGYVDGSDGVVEIGAPSPITAQSFTRWHD
jgi:nitroreductase